MSEKDKDRRLRRAVLKAAGGNLETASARLHLQADLAEAGDQNIAPNGVEGYAARRRKLAAELDRERMIAACQTAKPIII